MPSDPDALGAKLQNHILDLVSSRSFVKFWVRDTRVRGMCGFEGLRDTICFQFVPGGKRVSLKVISTKKKTDKSNSHEFELHRPSNKGTKLLLKVIKAIIIII